MESILTSIKKLLGIEEDDKSFDLDIITFINSLLFILTQAGVGPSSGFRIDGDQQTWNDFIPEEKGNFELVKSYIYMKARLIFDPPTNSTVLQSYKEMIAEFEWRLNVAGDSINFDGEEGDLDV